MLATVREIKKGLGDDYTAPWAESQIDVSGVFTDKGRTVASYAAPSAVEINSSADLSYLDPSILDKRAQNYFQQAPDSPYAVPVLPGFQDAIQAFRRMFNPAQAANAGAAFYAGAGGAFDSQRAAQMFGLGCGGMCGAPEETFWSSWKGIAALAAGAYAASKTKTGKRVLGKLLG